MNNPDETRPYIWLRYATQYTKNGRTHTVEMGIPVPLGAGAETREQLFREAEAGMHQLIAHVEQQVPQMVQRAQPAQSMASTPAQATRPVPAQKSGNIQSKPPATPAPEPVHEQTAVHTSAATVPPTRPNIAASMPLTLGPNGDTGNTLPLPEFIQYIKEYLDLTPKQAMEILKVKSLSTGINLRDALEFLKYRAAQDANSEMSLEQKARGGTSASPPAVRFVPTPLPASDPAMPPTPQNGSAYQEQSGAPIEEKVHTREQSTAYGFTEEIGPDEDNEPGDELEDFDLPPSIDPRLLERAHILIDELRGSQGAAVVNAKRLQVLNTVAISQVSEEQLQELIQGVWNISALKRLKVDQAEALISWAKQDYFVDELDAVLSVLEEERYARGNR